MAACSDGVLLAAGAYSGGIALFDARTREMLAIMEGHKGGLTQVSSGPRTSHSCRRACVMII